MVWGEGCEMAEPKGTRTLAVGRSTAQTLSVLTGPASDIVPGGCTDPLGRRGRGAIPRGLAIAVVGALLAAVLLVAAWMR